MDKDSVQTCGALPALVPIRSINSMPLWHLPCPNLLRAPVELARVCVFTGGQEGEAAPSVHIVATRGHPRPCPLAKAASRALVLGLFLLEIMLLKRTGSLSVVSPSCLTSPDLSNLAFKAVLIRKPGMWV